jgi:hypothetical protein
MTHEDAVRFGQALERSSALLITVPVDSTLEQGELAERARAWSNAHGRPLKRTELLARDYQIDEDATEVAGFIVCRLIDPYVVFRFDPQVGPDDLLAFAELVAPYAYPDKPRIALEPKGVEA